MLEPPSPRHLLIPFAGRGSPGCRAALEMLRLPRLEALLARLEPAQSDTRPEDTRSPPHERAMAQALGLGGSDGLIPWAALEARRIGLEGRDAAPPADAAAHGWGIATLCHWQVNLNEVVLGDPEAMAIDAAEDAALLEAARPFFEEDGIRLHSGGAPGRWLVRGRLFADLPTPSIDRAVGQPIEQWSPIEEATKPLRRLQNEMQMLLYTQRVNDERTARGEPAINSFWLSGTGRLPDDFLLEGGAHNPPLVPSLLRAPALADDGSAWAQAWQVLDNGAVAELLESAEGGAPVVLTLCGDRGAQRFESRGRSLKRWARSLVRRVNVRQVLEVL